MVDEDELNNLTDILTALPVATPFFVPDEILEIWFPPWLGAGSPDSASLKSAEEFGARFGCTFGYDAHMQNWCFTKQPNKN